MYNSYSTDYANQVHQLTISVSKHSWVTQDGIVKYQKKPMDIKLLHVGQSAKIHLVFYTVRDHFSGLFYSRVVASRSLVAPIDFLRSAWEKKADFAFCGLPDYLAIPDTVENAFPGTREAVDRLNVGLPKVTSGFQGGIRDIKTIEARIAFAHDQPFEVAEKYCLAIGRLSEDDRSREPRLTKAQLWVGNLPLRPSLGNV